MIIKNSLLLAFFSGLSVLLGIVRDRFLAHYVGVGATLDIYNASFRIPDLVFGIFIAFVTSSTVVPFISSAIHSGNKKELEQKINSLFFAFSLFMIVIILVIDIVLPYIAHLFVPGFNEAQITEYIFYTRILMIQPLLLGISALISCIAQARHHFILYSTVPLIYTLSIIVGIVVGYPAHGLLGIICGVISGAILHVTLQSYTLYKENLSLHHTKFSLAIIKEHLHLAVPRSGSIIVSQLRVVFFTAFATSFGAGALSIYLFAQKITDAIVQIIAQSLSTASLPALASFYTSNDIPNYTKSIRRHGVSLFGIGILFSVGGFFFSNEVVYLLYGTTNSNIEIAKMFQYLSLGIPFFALAWYLTYAFSAMKDTRSTLYANIISTIISMFICFIAKDRGMGIVSIAIGVVSVNILSSILMLTVYKMKKLHLQGAKVA